MVNTSGCGPEDRGFESRRPPHQREHAPVAQWTEHLASNQAVGGSNPSGRAKRINRDMQDAQDWVGIRYRVAVSEYNIGTSGAPSGNRYQPSSDLVIPLIAL